MQQYFYHPIFDFCKIRSELFSFYHFCYLTNKKKYERKMLVNMFTNNLNLPDPELKKKREEKKNKIKNVKKSTQH
jgi:hypothetical protein